MANDLSSTTLPGQAVIITPEALLQHWQGHRQLSRRVLEAFPENELFGFSIGGMRPFSEMALEMISLAADGIKGLATGKWDELDGMTHHRDAGKPQTKEELLKRWDLVTEQINTLWSQIGANRWQEVELAFGQYEGPLYSIMLYWVDNEIHHRGQGYVYLRALGIEPPPFWDRY
jgi:uncharacterized damage-inducible protein DinB